VAKRKPKYGQIPTDPAELVLEYYFAIRLLTQLDTAEAVLGTRLRDYWCYPEENAKTLWHVANTTMDALRKHYSGRLDALEKALEKAGKGEPPGYADQK
jgi:hypothetical protein